MQGFNMGRYMPPDHDPSKGNWNKQAGKNHALGNRASKLKSQGVLTVRFEMPFNIWCNHCDKHIGQGVRFNAEKKKIGNYYTTPIFSFRIRHTECNGEIEIHTDPQNTTYKVVEGGKRQAECDPKDIGVIQIKDPEEVARLENPFAKLEQVINDKAELSQQAQRIQDLYDISDRKWDDPYSHSQKVRRLFRAEKKERKEIEAVSEAIRDKHSLAIPLLEEINEDIRLAKMVDFSNVAYQAAIDEARSKPLFEDLDSDMMRVTKLNNITDGKTMLKKEKAMKLSRERLQKDLQRHTREKLDPFLLENNGNRQDGEAGNMWLKKKRHIEESQMEEQRVIVDNRKNTGSIAETFHVFEQGPKEESVSLVDYDSDE